MKRQPKRSTDDARRSERDPDVRTSGGSPTVAKLHRRYGNRRVRDLFEAGSIDGEADRQPKPNDGDGRSGVEDSRGDARIAPTVDRRVDGTVIQPKLEVSSPDDASEREAERVAEEVMQLSGAETDDGVEGIRGSAGGQARVDGQTRPGDHVQRAAIGDASDHPLNMTPSYFHEVPDDDRDRVTAAMRILDNIVENPDQFSACHDLFTARTNDERALEKTHERAEIWKSPRNEPGLYGEKAAASDEDIAYTDLAYRWGRWTLAATFLHEYAHLCDIDHPYGEQAVEAARLPTMWDIPD